MTNRLNGVAPTLFGVKIYPLAKYFEMFDSSLTKRIFYSHSNDKAVKLYAISHKINYREKRSSPWPLVVFISDFKQIAFGSN